MARRGATGFAAVGVAAFAVACCAGLPLAVAGLGGVALGAWLGAGAVAVVAAVAGLLVVSIHRRRRCAVERDTRGQR